MVSCSLPTNSCDPFGVAEVYQSVRYIKAIRGLRTFIRELGLTPVAPTEILIDARFLIDSTRCKRVSSESKWVAPATA